VRARKSSAATSRLRSAVRRGTLAALLVALRVPVVPSTVRRVVNSTTDYTNTDVACISLFDESGISDNKSSKPLMQFAECWK
jgi:hypothetical protein